MRAILDAETDNLLPFTSRIWCICVLEVDTNTWYTYLEGDRERFLLDSLRWTELVTFNGLQFDLFVLWKLWDIEFTVGPDTLNGRPITHTDLLVNSRYQNPDRNGGSHSLKTWGEVLGFRKTDWNDFGGYSEEMEAYCWNDCILTSKLYTYLMKEMNNEGQ